MEGKSILNRSLKRDLCEVDRFREDMVGSLEGEKIHSDVLAQLELAVYEVLVNIIEHDSSCGDDSEVRFALSLESETVVCRIEYNGDEFDINSYDLPDVRQHFSSGSKGGLGVYMIRNIFDRIEYARGGGRNFFTFYKKIS